MLQTCFGIVLSYQLLVFSKVGSEVRGTYTSACDLWSLGAMACVMLTGEPPFFGQKPEEDSTGPRVLWRLL